MTTDDYRMHCAPAGDHFGVDVFGEGSKLVVHYDFDASDPKGGKMSWGTHEEPLPPEPKRWMSCDSLSKLAGEITKVLPQIERDFGAKASKPLDSWGCDNLPQNIASCGWSGKCCDIHDACYAGLGCSASSWVHTFACITDAANGGPPVYECFTPCDYCNSAALACFPTLPGPSNCCGATCNVCGIPRNPANPLGCVADCQCGPNGQCIAWTGTCACKPQECLAWQCGTFPDGCGGTLYCQQGCVPPPPPLCTPEGGRCDQNANCCWGDCVEGVCS